MVVKAFYHLVYDELIHIKERKGDAVPSKYINYAFEISNIPISGKAVFCGIEFS